MFIEQRLELRTDIAARVCWHAKLLLMSFLEFVQGFYKSEMLFHVECCFKKKTDGSPNIIILSDSINHLHGVNIIIIATQIML